MCKWNAQKSIIILLYHIYMTDASCYYCFIRAHYCYILFSTRVYIIVKTVAAAAAADPIIRGENPCVCGYPLYLLVVLPT